MYILYVATAAAVLASLVASPQKTLAALRLAAGRLLKILPAFLLMLMLFAVGITLVPRELIVRLLGRDSGATGLAIAILAGSATLMPGFIAFPLAAQLKGQNVPMFILAGFTTSLMMVGVLTYPLERQYFGRNVTIIRNALSVVIAVLVALVIGMVFGELRP